MFRGDGVDDNGGLRLPTLVVARDEGCDSSRDCVHAINPSVREGSRRNSDTAAEDVHHVPRLPSLGLGSLPVLVAFDDGYDDVDTALGPSVGNDGATECCLEVDAKIPLCRISQIPTPLPCCEGCELDMS